MSTPLRKGQYISVHGYKHNGDLYRIWNKSLVLDVNDEFVVLVNDKVTVTELNGRKWNTFDPALWIFFPNKWYNVICMLRKDGIHYYCNLASPFLFEMKKIKYIDYDLDIKVFPNRVYKILDWKEYNENKQVWSYSEDLQKILQQNFQTLKTKIKKTPDPHLFNNELVAKYWKEYQNWKILKDKK